MEGSHGLQDPKGMQDMKGMRDTGGMAGMGRPDGMEGMAGMDMGATARSAPSPSTPPGGKGMRFLINGRSFAMGRIDEVSKVGQLESWSIVNGSDMDHPFHIHGTQFQVVDIAKAGAIRTPAIRCWKDTVNVAVGETVRIRLRQDLPGPRMYHCHILEHEELGMMGTLDVRA
jgi:FtsP/CotA-like multicopper oxidase with cupredoxin domain